VNREDAQRFAENEGMIYMEASAKTNKNVESIFTKLSSEMRYKYTTKPVVEKEEAPKKKIILAPLKP
jgi:coproporphyrinogen III oxidase